MDEDNQPMTLPMFGPCMVAFAWLLIVLFPWLCEEVDCQP
jgi:hypothetical protein